MNEIENEIKTTEMRIDNVYADTMKYFNKHENGRVTSSSGVTGPIIIAYKLNGISYLEYRKEFKNNGIEKKLAKIKGENFDVKIACLPYSGSTEVKFLYKCPLESEKEKFKRICTEIIKTAMVEKKGLFR